MKSKENSISCGWQFRKNIFFPHFFCFWCPQHWLLRFYWCFRLYLTQLGSQLTHWNVLVRWNGALTSESGRSMRWDVMENAHHFLPFCHSLMCSYALFGCFGLISSLLGCWKHVLIVFWCLVLSGWLTPVCMNGNFCFVSDFRCELFAITWGRSHCDMSVEMCCLWCIYMQKMTICLFWGRLDSVCMW